MKIIFCLLFILLSAGTVSAMDMGNSTSGCHCFRERTFDPKRPFAADAYLLTTSFNSFIAASFHISKSQIVMMKMKGGIDPDDLLIGLFVSRAADVELNSLIAVLENGGTWRDIFESDSLKIRESDADTFRGLIPVLGDREKAVEMITDHLLREYFGITDQELALLRKEGATGREIVLVHLLEKYGKRQKSAADIFAMHSIEKKSWSEIADFYGMTPKGTGRLLLDQQ